MKNLTEEQLARADAIMREKPNLILDCAQDAAMIIKMLQAMGRDTHDLVTMAAMMYVEVAYGGMDRSKGKEELVKIAHEGIDVMIELLVGKFTDEQFKSGKVNKE